jgi:hypothetical protein
MSVKNTDDLLSALLAADPNPEKDVFMKRFGKNFRIRAISIRERDAAREQATYPERGGGSRFDNAKFMATLILKGTVSPNFADPALIEKYGPTPADVITKLLLPGEYDRLGAEILTLSGFGDEEEAIEDVKN